MSLTASIEEVAELAESAKKEVNLVDSLVELGKEALEAAQDAVPEISAKAEEAVEATKRAAPKLAVAVGAVLVAGAIIGGIVIWRKRSAPADNPLADLAAEAEESAVVAQEAAQDAADSAADAAQDLAES